MAPNKITYLSKKENFKRVKPFLKVWAPKQRKSQEDDN